MNLKVALADYLIWEMTGETIRYYERDNPEMGYCIRCTNKLYRKGENIVHCEYHYLKKKYTSITNRCNRANEFVGRTPSENPYLKGIKVKFTWKEFLTWCLINKEYRRMKFPDLSRINKKKHYTLDNMCWKEQKAPKSFQKRLF
jgi:hypothetical protein